MKKTLLAMSLAAACSASADDDTRQVFVVWGVGNHPCAQYLDATKKGSAPTAAYEQWLDGYLTARNQTDPKVLDYAGSGRPGLVASIATYCQGNPAGKYYQAADRMLSELLKTGRVKYVK